MASWLTSSRKFSATNLHRKSTSSRKLKATNLNRNSDFVISELIQPRKEPLKNAMHKEDSDLSSWKRCWAAAWPVAHSPGVKERRYRYTTKRVRETILPNGAHLYYCTYCSETFVKLMFPNNIQKSRCTVYCILHANLRNLMLTSVHQKARLSSSVNCANVRIRSNIFYISFLKRNA